MAKVEVKGVIINNNSQEVYDWLEWDATSPRKVKAQIPNDTEPLEVYINSQGGSVFDGSEIYTMLKNHKGKVDIYVTGLAASIASVIAQANANGGKRYVTPTGQLMIHKVSTTVAGNSDDLESVMNSLKSADEAILQAYKQTGKSDEELLELMRVETWYNAKTAVEHGFADEVMFAEGTAQYNLTASLTNALDDTQLEKFKQLMQKEQPQAPSVPNEQVDWVKLEQQLKLM